MPSKITPSTGISNSKVLLSGLSVLLLLGLVLTSLFFWQKQMHLPQLAARPSDSPRQQVEFESGELFQESKKSQLQELEDYQWLDDQHHFARVPIERAMKIYLQRAHAETPE